MYWPDYDVEQLFDLRSDPIEDDDLLSRNATGKGPPMTEEEGRVLREMRKRFWELKRKIQDTRDPMTV